MNPTTLLSPVREALGQFYHVFSGWRKSIRDVVGAGRVLIFVVRRQVQGMDLLIESGASRVSTARPHHI